MPTAGVGLCVTFPATTTELLQLQEYFMEGKTPGIDFSGLGTSTQSFGLSGLFTTNVPGFGSPIWDITWTLTKFPGNTVAHTETQTGATFVLPLTTFNPDASGKYQAELLIHKRGGQEFKLKNVAWIIYDAGKDRAQGVTHYINNCNISQGIRAVEVVQGLVQYAGSVFSAWDFEHKTVSGGGELGIVASDVSSVKYGLPATADTHQTWIKPDLATLGADYDDFVNNGASLDIYIEHVIE